MLHDARRVNRNAARLPAHLIADYDHVTADGNDFVAYFSCFG
jgi:hypothetical protein